MLKEVIRSLKYPRFRCQNSWLGQRKALTRTHRSISSSTPPGYQILHLIIIWKIRRTNRWMSLCIKREAGFTRGNTHQIWTWTKSFWTLISLLPLKASLEITMMLSRETTQCLPKPQFIIINRLATPKGIKVNKTQIIRTNNKIRTFIIKANFSWSPQNPFNRLLLRIEKINKILQDLDYNSRQANKKVLIRSWVKSKLKEPGKRSRQITPRRFLIMSHCHIWMCPLLIICLKSLKMEQICRILAKKIKREEILARIKIMASPKNKWKRTNIWFRD